MSSEENLVLLEKGDNKETVAKKAPLRKRTNKKTVDVNKQEPISEKKPQVKSEKSRQKPNQNKTMAQNQNQQHQNEQKAKERAERKSEVLRDEIIDSIRNHKFEDRDLRELARFVEAKKKNPYDTQYLESSTRLGKQFITKIIDLEAIIEFAQYNAGASVKVEDYTELLTSYSKINEDLDSTVDKAYSKNIGNRWKVKEYKERQKKSQSKMKKATEEAKSDEKK